MTHDGGRTSLRALPRVLLCAVAGLAGACSTSTDSAFLTPAPSAADAVQCVPRGLGAEGLDAEWQPFAAHIQACVVIARDGTPALEIIAVSAQSYYTPLPQGTDIVAMPRPLILLPGGRIAARLLYNYPEDPPLAIRLGFEAWERDIPHRIRVYVSTPALSGDYELTPLLWDAAKRSYRGGEERSSTTTSGASR